ncbi:MAG: polysaccharide deacetylase family protein [Candidatus Binatia bacterium]
MRALADRGFRGISLREAVSHREAHGSWPTRCAVLTFDDGYANVFDVAVPALAQHGFTATVFLVTGHVGGRNDWAPPPAGLGTQPMLSWEQVAELSAAGMEVGAHTRTHPDLQRLSAAAAKEEIVTCRADIESRLQQPVESFAYPFGRVSPASSAIVRREFHTACTTVLRRAGPDGSHSLPRVDMYYVRSVHTFERLLSGRLDGYLAVRRWGRLVRPILTAHRE